MPRQAQDLCRVEMAAAWSVGERTDETLSLVDDEDNVRTTPRLSDSIWQKTACTSCLPVCLPFFWRLEVNIGQLCCIRIYTPEGINVHRPLHLVSYCRRREEGIGTGGYAWRLESYVAIWSIATIRRRGPKCWIFTGPDAFRRIQHAIGCPLPDSGGIILQQRVCKSIRKG